MASNSLGRLPALADACTGLGIETLTVCTLPPDLRLASTRDAMALIDALGSLVPALTCRTALVGRRFYLPDEIVSGAAAERASGLQLRLAVDYACRPSLLRCGPGVAEASMLLLPRGLEPGNLLRWHFARARRVEVDWQRLTEDALTGLLSIRHLALPRLIAAR
jgi:hypothetical protein